MKNKSIIFSFFLLISISVQTSIKSSEKCLDDDGCFCEQSENFTSTKSGNEVLVDAKSEKVNSVKCKKLERCISKNNELKCASLERIVNSQKCQSKEGCDCYLSFEAARGEELHHPFQKASTYCEMGARCSSYDGDPICERIIGYGESCQDYGGCECRIELSNDLSMILENSKEDFKSSVKCPFGSLCLVHDGDASCQKADFLEVQINEIEDKDEMTKIRLKIEKQLHIKFPRAENEDDYVLLKKLSELKDDGLKLTPEFFDDFIANLPQLPYSKIATDSEEYTFNERLAQGKKEADQFENEIRNKKKNYIQDKLFLIKTDFLKLKENEIVENAKSRMAEMTKIFLPYLKIGNTVFNKITRKYIVDMGEVCNMNIKKKKINRNMLKDPSFAKHKKEVEKEHPEELKESGETTEIEPDLFSEFKDIVSNAETILNDKKKEELPMTEESLEKESKELFVPTSVNEKMTKIKIKGSNKFIEVPTNRMEPKGLSKSLICVYFFGSSNAFSGAVVHFGLHVPVFTRVLESEGRLKVAHIDKETISDKNMFSFKCKQEECKCGEKSCKENEWCLAGFEKQFCNKINYTYLAIGGTCNNYAGCICKLQSKEKEMVETKVVEKVVDRYALGGFKTTCKLQLGEDDKKFQQYEIKALEEFGESVVLKRIPNLPFLEVLDTSILKSLTSLFNRPIFYCAKSEYCVCGMDELIQNGEGCIYEKRGIWRTSKFEINVRTICSDINGCICRDFSNKEKSIPARCVKDEMCVMPSRILKLIHKKIGDGLKGVQVFNVDVGGVISAIPTVMKCSTEYKKYWKCENQDKCYCSYPFGYCDKDEYCRISKLKNSCSKDKPDLNETDVFQSIKNIFRFWKKPEGKLI